MQAPVPSVQRAYERLKQAAIGVPSFDERDDRLQRLERLMVERRDDFVRTISDDFGRRARVETLSTDVLLTVDAIRYARRHLREWMTRRPVRPHPFFLPSSAYVEHRPRGVVGIIAPWNYPVNLAFGPLAAAFAAGNRVLVKPSELTPKTSSLMQDAIAERFSADEVSVVTGGADVARAVTELPLDALLFTGSTAVGKLVAQAAAKNLTPVTLELGGKSPALVHASFDLATAAERIVLGKLFNGGQTCIAPDYALVPRGSEARFVAELKKAVARGYPRLDGMSSLITERGHQRLLAIVEDARAKGARVETLGDFSPGGRVMSPVALLDVTDDMLAMQEELFGPVLPIETYDSLDGAIARINARPHPLAFYYFDDDARRAEDVLSKVTSGGACVNDTLVHFAQETLPFGGVGASGLGAYHGRAGFETFSHARSVLVASRLSPARRLLAPPLGVFIEKALEVLVRGASALQRR
ncbi:MAG: coniferyl aldehyde dehydrogenase [Myxococcales bacterium]|nr:coniferyl aldehyde dehydrogenase [Myxococcales bacterium]MDP3500467.1 coniferyl aldehyde dehydrogenase [Myxococcales bacterium]